MTKREEAKHLLNRLFKVPSEYSNGFVERFVDLIVEAAKEEAVEDCTPAAESERQNDQG